MNKVKEWKYKYFTPQEFECHCGCRTNAISSSFVHKLSEARRLAGDIDIENCSFNITSGCRCKRHNKDIGGKEDSLHLSGEGRICHAADISIISDRKRAVVLMALIQAGFTHIGIGKDFIHVDDSHKKGIWLYS